MNRITLLKSMFALVLLAMLPSMTTAATETITWIHTDHLGSPIAGRNAAGETTWEQAYAPWGERQAVAGVPQAPAGVGYTGHVHDEQVGLIYAGARWYEPSIGRFISPDVVRYKDHSGHSFNRYAYANNGPYIYTDPNGAWASQAGFYVHQRATYQVIGINLSRSENKILADAQVYADGAQFQNGESSYRHAMSGPGQTPDEARAQANEFVRGQFEKAWAAESREDALFQFGIALHALQDATSPSHEGFQQWTGHETRGQQIQHARKELINPGKGSRLHEVTATAWQWFNDKKLPSGDLFQ